MILKTITSLALTLLVASCANGAEKQTENAESATSVASESSVDVPRDTTPINEKDSLTATTGVDGAVEEGYGTSGLSDALIKTGVVIYMEATSSAYAANELGESETFEGLDRYLSKSAESWLDGVVSATNKGVLPVEATFTVNGTDFRELTGNRMNPEKGISLGMTLREVTCTMVGTFYEKADLVMEFSWAAPTCSK